MNILDTPLPDLKIVQSLPFRDARGVFGRVFCAEELKPLLGAAKSHRSIIPRRVMPALCVGCTSKGHRTRR